MTNLEKHRDEIFELYRNSNKYGNTEKFYEACEKVCRKYSKYQVLYVDLVWRWISSNYIEPIILSRIEKSLICFYLTETNKQLKFKDIRLLNHLKNNGHFKGVYDVNMTIYQIANNMKIK